MDDDSEPTWGDSVAGATPPTPDVPPVPNQRSMPVVGRSVPPPVASNPHAEYQRQTEQHFGASTPLTGTPSLTPHPVVPPPPLGPPAGYASPNPVSYQPIPRGTSGQTPPTYPVNPARESFVLRLMQRGARGELLRQPWFHDMRQRNADPFVYVSFGVGVVVSLLLLVIPSSFVVSVLTTALWVGIGYLYFALGTKLAHQFLLFGICLVGGLVMAARALSAMVGLSIRSASYYGFGYESVAELMFVMLLNLAGVAAFIYVGVQVYRGIQQMSRP